MSTRVEVSLAEGLAFAAEVGAAPEEFCRGVLERVWAEEGRELALSVHFAGDAEIAQLHGDWLGDPVPTDVISFPLTGDEHGAGAFDGELVIGYEHARRVAAQLGQSFAAELALYLVHGALHLLGYDDHDEQDVAAMKKAERRVLAALGHDVSDRYDDDMS